MSRADEKLNPLEHLQELRRRLLLSVIAVGIGVIICFIFYNQIFAILKYPAAGIDFVAVDMTERISSIMTVCVVGGIILAMPAIVYNAILFIAPALAPREKRVVLIIIPWIFLMFLMGVAFGYFMLAPWAIRFLYVFGGDIAEMYPRISSYVGFIMRLMLVTGLIFEMPVITTLLARLKLLRPESLARRRPIALIISFVVGAALTPPDPITQVLLAVPLIALYEISIILARIVYPKDKNR